MLDLTNVFHFISAQKFVYADGVKLNVLHGMTVNYS
jgi:hypothetical protein